MKQKSGLVASLFLLMFIFCGCAKNPTNTTPIHKNNNTLDNEKIVVSAYNREGKSSITLVNPKNGLGEVLLDNRDVWLSGEVSSDGKSLVYVDAIGDTGAWNVFLRDLKTKKTYQVTNDSLGQLNARFGDKNGKVIYSEVIGNSGPASKIVKIDTENKNSVLLDSNQKDRSAEKFDVFENKIVGAFVSESQNNKRWEEANMKDIEPRQLPYSICEMDKDGKNMREISKINAINIDFISYGADGKYITFGGEKIGNDSGSGIYKLSIENGKLERLLTDTMLKEKEKSIVSKIGKERYGVLSKDGKKLYFAGVPKDAKEVTFKDITSKPRSLYQYDLETKEIEQIYDPKGPVIITDVTISY